MDNMYFIKKFMEKITKPIFPNDGCPTHDIFYIFRFNIEANELKRNNFQLRTQLKKIDA